MCQGSYESVSRVSARMRERDCPHHRMTRPPEHSPRSPTTSCAVVTAARRDGVTAQGGIAAGAIPPGDPPGPPSDYEEPPFGSRP